MVVLWPTKKWRTLFGSRSRYVRRPIARCVTVHTLHFASVWELDGLSCVPQSGLGPKPRRESPTEKGGREGDSADSPIPPVKLYRLGLGSFPTPRGVPEGGISGETPAAIPDLSLVSPDLLAESPLRTEIDCRNLYFVSGPNRNR